jgi:long-subunit acyl-CoA synthetase (AMP-forming)
MPVTPKVIDQLKTPLAMFYEWEKSRPNTTYMSQPLNGEWIHYTWAQAGQEIRKLASWLKAQGYEPGSKIAIVSKNCAHWIMADLAIQMAGMISVPIYPNVNAETVRYVLEHSESKMLFVGKLDQPNWDVMRDGVPEGFHCMTFPGYGQAGYPVWTEVLADVEPVAENPEGNLEDTMSIIYTSGTTGTPKGVVLQTLSPVFAIHYAKQVFNFGDTDRFFSYLPLSHIAERMLIEMGSLVSGGTIHFAESLDTFVDNLNTCSPTIFLAVPRIWTKFQMGVLAKLPPQRLKLLLSLPIINNVIRKKIRTNLGLKDAHICLSGAAPIPVTLLEWYKKVGIEIFNVYGMTENSAYSFSNLPNQNIFGSAGVCLPEVDVKITDDSEILIRSAANMVEYYKEPEKTAEALDSDGYLHTGDCGEIDANGFLRITGRVKDLFKTSKAKYVAPTPIELKLAKNSNVEQVCVVGTGIPQPIALVVPSDAARNMEKDALSASLAETLGEVNPELEHHERLQNIVVLDEPWTPENGMLTPTLKIKRNEVDKRFSKHYEAWYGGGKGVLFA